MREQLSFPDPAAEGDPARETDPVLICFFKKNLEL